MKRKRRMEIWIETDERFIFRRPTSAVPVRCGACAGRVVTAAEAVAVVGLSSRTIHRWVEDGKIHYTETAAGLWVCLDSLMRSSN